MPERDILVSTMILGAGHSIMLSHSKKVGKANEEQFNKFFEAIHASKDTVAKFGLFGGEIDYNTYYPDATSQDFNPGEDEFIEPVFRLLSSCIVSKNYSPTEFPEEVLKASIPLLIGQTVNCDHETNIGNAIGSVVDAFWQNGYTTKDGHKIPGGINGVLKIDAKANPRIARGINMDPPSIHSNSVTVQFEWKPSHQFDTPYEFWDKLGTYDDKGEMVRRIATRIISYKETSLVSHGADPFAQIVKKDGKIINPGYADSVYNSFSEEVKEKVSNSCKSYSSIDYKGYSLVDSYSDPLHKTSKNIIEGEDKAIEEPINKSINNTSMNKEFQEFLEKLFGEGMLTLAEGSEASVEVVLSEVKRLIQENAEVGANLTAANEKITSLEEENLNLKNEAKANNSFIEIGKNHFKEVKEATLASYNKLNGEKVDANIVTLIESMDSISTLISLKASYDQQLDEKFPLHCSDCGSHNINRASSVNTVENKEKKEELKDKSIEEVIAGLAEKKR